MANPASSQPDESGLVILKLCGKDWPARISIRAAMIAEKLLDVPLHRILERIITSQEFFLEQMATVFREAMIAAGGKDVPDVETVAESIVDIGQPKFAPVYMQMLLGALKGRRKTDEGEATASKT